MQRSHRGEGQSVQTEDDRMSTLSSIRSSRGSKWKSLYVAIRQTTRTFRRVVSRYSKFSLFVETDLCAKTRKYISYIKSRIPIQENSIHQWNIAAQICSDECMTFIDVSLNGQPRRD